MPAKKTLKQNHQPVRTVTAKTKKSAAKPATASAKKTAGARNATRSASGAAVHRVSRSTRPAPVKAVRQSRASSAGQTNAARTAAAQKRRVRPAPSADQGNGSARWGLLCAGMICALMMMGYYAVLRLQTYGEFRMMRSAVERAGFYNGIVIDGVNVSGLSLDAAIEKLEARDRKRRESMEITLRCGDRTWTLTADEMDYGSNYISVARHAWQVGRGGSLEERYAAIHQTNTQPISYSVNYGYDKTLLRASLEAVSAEMTVAAKPAKVASFDVQNRTFTFSGGQDGYAVDTDRLYGQVVNAIEANEGGSVIQVQRQKISAGVTTQTLMGQYGEITSAVTNASSSSANRLTNIRLALSLINGVRIDPGETFSFNGTVGKRTTQRGFKMAGAYENGLNTEEVGGGICQVSTTLFNAAVKADMTIVERSPHSKPVAYVDKGKDAAVDWPGTDLKFRNDTDEPVYIVAWLGSDKRVRISIYGKKPADGSYIRVEAVTTDTIQPGKDKVTYNESLEPGETVVISKARIGYKAVAYKVYYSASGNEIRREVLCRSNYAAAAAVVEKGPRE